jgi:hypothetical protein
MTRSRERASGARALTLCAAVASLSVAGHALGGGHLPSVAALVVALAMTFPATVPLTRGTLRPWPTIGLLGLGQAAWHVVLTLLTPGAAHATSGAPLDQVPDHHAALSLTAPGAAFDLSMAPRMWLGHLVGALLLGAVIGHLDAAADRLSDHATRALRLLRVPPLRVPDAVPGPVAFFAPFVAAVPSSSLGARAPPR